MKRLIEVEEEDDLKMKKVRIEEEEEAEEDEAGVMQNLDENLLFEVFKHVDARTLARASCVSKLWHRTSQDERLWELICTRHSANIGCGKQQLRSVVLALGGFRRLHSLYLLPLSKPQSFPGPVPPPAQAPATATSPVSAPAPASSTVSSWPGAGAPRRPLPPMIGAKPPVRWGKDEVHLSLSLLSIKYYEMMNFNTRGR